MQTFISCDYNRRMITDFSLERRVCLPCPIASPYSQGFATSICSTCDNLSESIDRAEPYEQYMYRAACLKVVEPDEPVIDPNPLPDTDSGEDTNPVDENSTTDGEEEKPVDENTD